MLLGSRSSEEYHGGVFDALKESDEQVYMLVVKEYERLQNTLQLMAAENLCSQAVLAALGSVIQNKTAEGFPAARIHGGCEVVDDIERLAVARAKDAFGAQYANVQPHSGTSANQIVITAVLEPSDKILSMALDQGGHYSHGADVSVMGKFFDVQHYNVDRTSYRLDYETIRKQALQWKPKLIICGASVYARTIDFKKFREIADQVGAYLMADISHISGLVIAVAHPSPIDYAHFTTTSTYKPGGPRGGVILMGKDYDQKITMKGEERPLFERIQETTFPGMQGTPCLNNIAAKAIFFKETLTDEYKIRQFKIVENAKRLAQGLLDLGYDLTTGGTDNHMVVMNASNSREGLTGTIAQKCLGECGIVVNMNTLPFDERDSMITSGLRLGTPIVTRNGMGTKEMDEACGLIDAVLKNVELISGSEYRIDGVFRDNIKGQVKDLCSKFPIC